jgi:hypothetical protein
MKACMSLNRASRVLNAPNSKVLLSGGKLLNAICLAILFSSRVNLSFKNFMLIINYYFYQKHINKKSHIILRKLE